VKLWKAHPVVRGLKIRITNKQRGTGQIIQTIRNINQSASHQAMTKLRTEKTFSNNFGRAPLTAAVADHIARSSA
jgi:hypothetical protein